MSKKWKKNKKNIDRGNMPSVRCHRTAMLWYHKNYTEKIENVVVSGAKLIENQAKNYQILSEGLLECSKNIGKALENYSNNIENLLKNMSKEELINQKIENETIEDLMDDHDCETSQGEGCQVCCNLLPNYVE